MTVARYALVIACWGLLTTLAAWVIGPRHDTPGPLEVLTVRPAYAEPRGAYPADVGNAVRRAQARHDANIQLLQAAALLEAARKATTTTTVRARTAPTQRVTVAAAPVVPSGPVPEGCMTGTLKSRAESDRCWTPLLAAYTDWSIPTMQLIVYCESKGDESAVNRIGATGLVQLYPAPIDRATGVNVGLDPVTNVRLGHDKYVAAGGYSPWSASSGCW